jgi:hypothetical protein
MIGMRRMKAKFDSEWMLANHLDIRIAAKVFGT